MRMRLTLYIAWLFLVFSCTGSKPYRKLEGQALGTSFHITYADTVDFSSQTDSLFRRINAALSTYHKNSVISRFNRSQRGMVIHDAYFVEVFDKAKRIYRETGGLFDPSVGILVNAWDFGPEKDSLPPDTTRVKKLLNFTGFDKMVWKNDTLTKPYPEMYLDFNAIAKGYAVDVLGRFLESRSVEDYMVEIGGEIRCRGRNPRGGKWVIGVEKPLTDGSRAIQKEIEITDMSMATSGNYRKYRIDKNGRKYVHTINPLTGFPEINDLLSATVITTGDCADADAYATSMMVMGYRKARDFILRKDSLSAYFIYLDENGKIQTDEVIPKTSIY